MNLKRSVLRLLDAFTCFVRKTSRPIAFAGVSVGTWVNLVLIPLYKWETPNLQEASFWIAAVGALSWVRHKDKVMGVAD